MISPLAKTLTLLTYYNRVVQQSFNPASIAGLKVWYDFSDTSSMFQDTTATTPVTADGDIVGRVNDKTLNANNAIQSVTSKKPLYKTGVQNGLGGVKFDNADDFLQMTTALSGASQTVFACVKWASSADQEEYLFGRLDGVSTIAFWGYDDNTKGMRFYSGGGNYFGGLKLTDVANSARVHTLSISSNVGSLYINSAAQSGSVTIGTAFVPKVLGTSFGAGFFSDFFGGHFLEVLAYDTALSAGDMTNIHNYLNGRWAVY